MLKLTHELTEHLTTVEDLRILKDGEQLTVSGNTNPA